MTRIEELVDQIEIEKSKRKEVEGLMAMHEYEESKKTTVTTRFDSYHMFVIDFMANDTDSSRSAILHNIVVAGLFDLVEKLGLKEEIEQAFVKHIKEEAAENV